MTRLRAPSAKHRAGLGRTGIPGMGRKAERRELHAKKKTAADLSPVCSVAMRHLQNILASLGSTVWEQDWGELSKYEG